MRFQLRTAIYSAAAVFLSFIFCLMPDTVTDAVSSSLYICASRVVPSVFPFTVLSSFFIKSGGSDRIDRLLSRPFYKLFGLRLGASALFCGLLFGFPLGAMCIGALYRSERITAREATRLLTFAACASPTFPFFSVGIGMFGSFSAGILMFCVPTVIFFLIGIFLNLVKPIKSPSPVAAADDAVKLKLTDAVTSSVADASRVILTVCGAVTFFSLLGRIAGVLLSPLFDSPYPALCISALFEFSSACAGSAEAYSSGCIGCAEALAISAFSIGFSGLSVICQSISVLQSEKIQILPHIVSKFANGAISAVTVYFIAKHLDIGVNASIAFPHESFSPVSFLPSAVIFTIFTAFLIKNQKSA